MTNFPLWLSIWNQLGFINNILIHNCRKNCLANGLNWPRKCAVCSPQKWKCRRTSCRCPSTPLRRSPSMISGEFGLRKFSQPIINLQPLRFRIVQRVLIMFPGFSPIYSEDCMIRINKLLRSEKLDQAIALLRAARWVDIKNAKGVATTPGWFPELWVVRRRLQM